MGNDDAGFVSAEPVNRFHHGGLRFAVQGGGGLVQKQDVRVVIEGPGNADPLPLAPGDPDAPFTDHGVQPVFQPPDKVRQLGGLQGLPDPVVVDFIAVNAQSHVGPDGFVHQVDVLGNVTDAGLPLRVAVPDVPAAVADPALLGLQQAQNQIHQGGFACAGDAHNAHAGAAADGERHVLQHGLLHFGIGEAEILDPDIGQLMIRILLPGWPAQGLGPEVHAPVFVDDLADRVEAGHQEGHGVDVGIDGVGAGQQLDGGHREGGEASHDGAQILPGTDLEGHQPQHAAHTEDLHQMPGHSGQNGIPAIIFLIFRGV